VVCFRPELVGLDAIEPLPEGERPGHAKTVTGAWHAIDWVRQVPQGYVRIPHVSPAQKGARMARAGADACAEILRATKRYGPEADL
jgi:hypothetical protein